MAKKSAATARVEEPIAFTIDRQPALHALGRVIGAVDKRSTMPILGHVLVRIFLRGAVEFQATDLEVFATAECEAGVPGAGCEICAPADKLKAALDGISEPAVQALVQDGQLILQAQGFDYQIATLPASDFPAVPNALGPAPLCLPPGLLGRIRSACAHAADPHGNNVALTGISIGAEGSRLVAAASDGHRLSLAAVEMDDPFGLGPRFILPDKASRLLAGIVGTVHFSRPEEDNILHFDHAGGCISSRIVDAKFPDFRRVIPDGLDAHLVVDRQRLIDALEACGLFADDRARSVTLEVSGENLIATCLGDHGQAVVTVPCIEGTGFRSRVNSRYLLQALKALAGEEVFIKYVDPSRPLVLVPVDHDRWDERVEVLMPMRV